MAIPTYDKCMLPLLQFASDGVDHHVREAIDALGQYFGLSQEDRSQRIRSGKKFTFDDRVQWANTYLKKAGFLISTGRGRFQITNRGLTELSKSPSHIDAHYLMQFPEFAEFAKPPLSNETHPNESASEREVEQTPQEVLQSSYQLLVKQLAQELLETIMDCSDSFFESLVMDLLLALGYGEAVEAAGEVVGGPGDGGIDVRIKEDELGFDIIYVQAKRWKADSSVGSKEIQSFAGSLLGHGATKGVFITTSSFSRSAIAYVSSLKQQKIILIDGEELAKLMIKHNIGVSPVGNETYTVKRVDRDYFQID
ncbi:MAG: restriction endonuclease [Anaerolineae bacterium]